MSKSSNGGKFARDASTGPGAPSSGSEEWPATRAENASEEELNEWQSTRVQTRQPSGLDEWRVPQGPSAGNPPASDRGA